MFQVRVTGLEELRRKFARLTPAVEAEIQASLEKSGEEMVSLARALAPVDDGDLRDSIVMTTPGNLTPIYGGGGQQKVGPLGVRITAGDYLVRYAAIVEFGRKATATAAAMAARPFFWPAYRLLRRRIRSRTARAITSAIKKAARG